LIADGAYIKPFLMAEKKEARIREIHERFLEKFMHQIVESLRNIHGPAGTNESAVGKNDSGPDQSIKEVPTPLQEEHGGPDRINEIRNEVAATQSDETGQPAEILNPDMQCELMEIVRKGSEAFELELRRMPSLDKSVIESAAQKFKDELMDNVRNQLKEKNIP
jgi:hypothetical protein